MVVFKKDKKEKNRMCVPLILLHRLLNILI